MTTVVLWDYPKSSASYRVRIALNLARISYDTEIIDLSDGAHRLPAHLARNPQGLVPVLDIDGARFTQSLAILDYLNTTRDLGLLPQDPARRAKVQALSHIIAVDLHPVCNLSVATHATQGNEPARTRWMQHFMRPKLDILEAELAALDRQYIATQNTVSLLDICLIPQLYNAKRWNVTYDDLTQIKRIEDACAHIPAFQIAHPDFTR